MKAGTWIALFFVALATSVSASANADEATKKAVALLYAYEAPHPSVWSALPPSAIKTLIRIYDSKKSPKHVRLRTVAAAGFLPSKTTQTFLRRVASDKKLASVYTRRAVTAMSYAFGEGAIDDIQKHLASRRADVREAAVASLVRLKSDKADRLVSAHLLTERNARVLRAAKRRAQ